MEFFNRKIIEIKGVGPKKEELLNSMGISTVGELLHYFPSKYDFYSFYDSPDEIKNGGKAVFYLEYDGKAVRKYSPKTGYYVVWQTVTKEKILNFTWFNQPYMINTLKKGQKYAVLCDIEYKGKLLAAQNPHLDMKNKYTESFMVPKYRTPEGLSSNQLWSIIKTALEGIKDIPDAIPCELRDEYKIKPLSEALFGVHAPQSETDGISSMQRFIFEEFFMFRLRQTAEKKDRSDEDASISVNEEIVQKFYAGLPFEPTNAQKQATEDILNDIKARKPMNRIIQGDVGSGKTLVAAAACLAAKTGGVQSIVMAPTEVLARQHLQSFEDMLSVYGVKIGLLAGGMTKSQKQTVKKAFANGETDILIGTHAVLEDNVEAHNVGLVITDEQHRFGVKQRLGLKNKGKPANMLVLTATPIPRTLALVIYSDLDISVINEMPKGRIPIKTYRRTSNARGKVYDFVLGEIKNGHQAYVICPSVDEDDEGKASVKKLYGELCENELRSVKCAYLYGAMRSGEKEEAMRLFAEGKTDVLISTTVIEVGVNVPNATVMVIENAERFGLAQLHQLRGRVGRGKDKSYCILLSDSDAETATARLDMLTKTNDGFEIAGEDLRLRGQGEYFGLRQHGDNGFKLGELPRDAEIFAKASKMAQAVKADGKYKEYYEQMLQKAVILNEKIVFN